MVKTAAKAKEEVCNETNIMSDERSDYLQVRCGIWHMPELAEKAYELQYTPAGVKIYEHWRRTSDVYYLRRNFEQFMSMQPLTKEQCKMEEQSRKKQRNGAFLSPDPKCIDAPHWSRRACPQNLLEPSNYYRYMLLQSSLFLPSLLRPPLLYIISDHTRINVHYLKSTCVS